MAKGTHTKWPEVVAEMERQQDRFRTELATAHTELTDANEEIERLRDENRRLQENIRDLEWNLRDERARNDD